MLIPSPSSGYWINTDKPGGRVFFVGGGTVAAKGKTGTGIGASDTNDGQDPTRPLLTIAQGVTLAREGAGDTIVVLPGAVTITAAISLSKTDLTLMGYTEVPKGTRNPSVITCATDSVEMINIDKDNVVVKNLTLVNTASTSDTYMIDVADSEATSGVVLENLFIDCESGAAALNAIRLGDGTLVCTESIVKDCTIHDLDDIGIHVSAASDENRIEGNIIYDGVGNTALYAIYCEGDGCTITGNEIRTDGTSGIQLKGTLNQLNNNRVSAVGANSIAILLENGATAFGNGNVVTAIQAGNLIDATSDADSPTVFADTGNVHAADPATAALVTPTIGGS